MPKELDDCVKKLTPKYGKDKAYAICTANFKKKHGMTPQEWEKKNSKGMFDETKAMWVRYSPVMAHIDFPSDGDYIRIRLRNPEEMSSFSIKWIQQEDGIKGIYGLSKASEEKLQALLFDKKRWTIKDAIQWRKSHFSAKTSLDVECIAQAICSEISLVDVVAEKTQSEISITVDAQANKIELVTAASIEDFDELVEAGLAPKISEIENEMAKAGMPAKDKDLMFVAFKLAHVGTNANRDEFLPGELEVAKDTPVHKLVNWQHDEPNIGCIVSSSHVDTADGEPAHIHVVSAISKMKYPAFADELLERFEEKRLFASMETWFETAKCSVCGGTYQSQHDYCDHLNARFDFGSDCSRQLIGLTFAGAAVAVNRPADKDATITNVDD